MSARKAPNPSGAPPLPDRAKPGDDALSVLLGVSTKGPDLTSVESSISAVLHEAGEPIALNDLAGRVKVDFLTLSSALVDMENRSMVRVEGPPGCEIIQGADGTLLDS